MPELKISTIHSYILNDDYQNIDSGIFPAIDSSLNRKVMIKTQKVNNDNDYQKALTESKALIEAKSRGLNVPHIYETYYDNKLKRIFIIMEYINGQTLSELMDRINDLDFINYMIDLCQILIDLNKAGIKAHKDIKPDNIMIKNRNLYLIDFNISISLPNQIEGTPIYKAPEMDMGALTTDRSKVDIFSIGVILYEKFTKTRPIRNINYSLEDGEKEWSYFEDPKQLNNNIPTLLNEIIIKAMKFNPKNRQRDLNELKNELYKTKRSLSHGK